MRGADYWVENGFEQYLRLLSGDLHRNCIYNICSVAEVKDTIIIFVVLWWIVEVTNVERNMHSHFTLWYFIIIS